ncbi:hypothetical protein MRX96_015783 [Rhipicephalus microplus]
MCSLYCLHACSMDEVIERGFPFLTVFTQSTYLAGNKGRASREKRLEPSEASALPDDDSDGQSDALRKHYRTCRSLSLPGFWPTDRGAAVKPILRAPADRKAIDRSCYLETRLIVSPVHQTGRGGERREGRLDIAANVQADARFMSPASMGSLGVLAGRLAYDCAGRASVRVISISHQREPAPSSSLWRSRSPARIFHRET